MRRALFAALTALAWTVAAPAAAQLPAGWQVQAVPATDSTKLIALAGSPDRNTVGLLYTDAAPGRNEQLRLMSFDASGKARRTADLGARGDPLREHAAIAFDGTGNTYAAAPGESGVRLARLDARGAVAPFGKGLAGAGGAKVGALLHTRDGTLLVSGALDGKGFVAALSAQGETVWSRSFDQLVAVFDIIEHGDAYVVAGALPGEMFPAGVWLGRLGRDGAVLDEQTRTGPTRYAHLASDGRRVGLLYEQLDAGLETGSVLLELYAGAALREPARQTLFQGALAAPFTLSGGGGRFTAAGVAKHGRLQVIAIDATGKASRQFEGKASAPDYTRFHSVDVVRSATGAWLAGLRSHADGQRRQFELVLAKVPDQ